MKNVKPMVGRTFKQNSSGGIHKVRSLNPCSVYFDGIMDPVGLYEVINGFTFIPQNDLEWLACQRDEWPSDSVAYVSKESCQALYYQRSAQGRYTRQQLQSMRYELGLDEKPKAPDLEAFAKGCGVAPPTTMNCQCALTPTKKEAKMIDLSNAKVGDEFVDLNDNKIKIVYVNNHAPNRYVGTINGGSACVYDKLGKNIDPTCVDIVSKHDPAPGLKICRMLICLMALTGLPIMTRLAHGLLTTLSQAMTTPDQKMAAVLAL